ncbi:ABC transporter ATP-binding protein [Chitinophaga vietnamensis]|uniref:ABC transporter ATP-binding protein n=1 Tax=Chitinophaga vietnamensis TaxID=2593957 RepID=UPI001178A56E|nr:ABC transporter ATP-binding protein [Chitinophaga vietnamensis]
MSFLQVSDISKRLQGAVVVNHVSFTQQRFQRVAIAGETGSGKSTLLRIIAGLVQTDEGKVTFEGKRVEGPLEVLIPGHPGIAYLSQHFELRNNFRMEEILDRDNKLIDEDAAKIYDICRISHLLKRKNDQLSGGERQRVALARLLTMVPRLLVLDEPFSNLDMIHKSILKSVIEDIGKELQLTVLLTSHDPQDVLSWADDIIVMQQGSIIQQGTPQQVYNQPVNEYAAALFGKYNLLKPAAAKAFKEVLPLNGKQLFVRPEQLQLVADDTHALKGTVTATAFFGGYEDVVVKAGREHITVRTAPGAVKQGDKVFVSLRHPRVWLL